jgi:hypothetical protein
MAKTIKTGLIITGDARGGVSALKLTDDQLKGLNDTQKKAVQHNKDNSASFSDLSKKVAAYGSAAALAAAAGVGVMVKQQLSAIDSTAKVSDKLGIATESLTALRIQAELSGVAANTLDMGLQRMVRRVGEAAQGTGEAKDALKELNINAAELAKLSPDQQFAAIGDAMGDVGSQSDRVRLAFKLFDSEGVALLNTLKGGSAAALEAAAFTEQWGLAINRVDSAKIEQANDAMSRVGQASEGLWKQLAVKVSPALTGIANELLGVGSEMSSAKDTADALFDGMIAGIGFVADAARGLQIVWKGVTVVVAQTYRGIFAATAGIDSAITSLLNKLPEFAGGGNFTESQFFQNISDAVGSTATELTQELKDLTTKALPSQSIKKWLRETEDDVQKTAEKIAAEANVSTALINSNINTLPDTLAVSTGKMVATVQSSTSQIVTTVQRETPKATSVYVTAWDRAIERVDETFADAWAGAFDGFKSFGDSILDSFKTLLAEMAHLAITKPIIIGLGMGGSGVASAGDGTGLFGASSGGGGFSVADLLSAGKSLINGGLTGAHLSASRGVDYIANLLYENGFGNAASGLLESSAGFAAQGGGNLALGGLYTVGSGFAGGYAGNKIGGGLFGKEANSNIGATAGAGIGAYVGSIVPVIGTALGSAVGGFIGGLTDSALGGDGKERVSLGVLTEPGSLSPGHKAYGASGLELTAYAKRAGSEGTALADQLAEAAAYTDTVLTGLYEQLGTTVNLTGRTLDGKAAGAGTDWGKTFFGSAEYNGINQGDVESVLDDFTGAWQSKVEELTGFVVDLSPFEPLMKEGEALADTISRVQIEFVGVTGALDALGFELIDFSVTGMAAADGLVQAFGGLDQLSTGINAYYDAFYTDGEKLEKLGDSLTQQFNELGLAVPQTHEGFRALVDGLDLTTSAAQTLFAQLVSLAPSLDTYLSSASSQVAVATQSISDMSTSILGSYNDERAALQSNADARIKALRDEKAAMLSVANALLDTVDQLNLSTLSPLSNKARLDFAKNQYSASLAAAQGGDLAAAGALSADGQAYLKEAASYYASSGQYTDIFNSVTGSLGDLGKEFKTEADVSADIARIQTKTLGATLSLGNTALSQLQQAVRMTAGIDSVAELLAVLPAELSADFSSATGVQAADLSNDPIYELYSRGLNKTPDADGYAFWQNMLDSGKDYESLKELFFASALENGATEINRFNTGTPFVSHTQKAIIDYGEIIIDKESADALRKYGINVGTNSNNNDALLAEMKALRNEVAALRNERASDAASAAQQRNSQRQSIERTGRQMTRNKVTVLS